MVFTIPPPILPSDFRTVQDVDDILEQLRVYTQELKVTRNALNTAASLPADVIIEIILELANIHNGRWSPAPGTYDYCRWLSVTHICKSWRNIALNVPLLWSCVVWYGIPNRVETFLRRSGGQCPLTIVLLSNARYGPIKEFQYGSKSFMNRKFVAEYAHRLLEVHRIDVDYSTVDSLVAKENRAVLPILDTLHAPDYVLSRFMLLCDMPRLTHLDIVQGSVLPHFSPLLRHTLTALHVLLSTDSTPLPAWLDALEGLPLLKELTIHGWLDFPRSDGMMLTPTRRVSLPRLRHLELGPPSQRHLMVYGILLVHLACPSRAHVTILPPGKIDTFFTSTVHPIVSYLSSWSRENVLENIIGDQTKSQEREMLHFCEVSIAPYKSQGLAWATSWSDNTLSYKWYYENPGPSEVISSCRKPRISLSLPFPTTAYNTQGLVLGLPDTPLFSDLTHLTLSNFIAHPDVWQSIAERCQAVTSLRVSSHTSNLGQLRKLINVLGLTRNGELYTYPRLEALQVRSKKLHGHNLPPPDGRDLAGLGLKDGQSIRQGLSNVLCIRSRHGLGPRVLQINGRDCVIPVLKDSP